MDQPTVENLSRVKQRDSIEKGCVKLEEKGFFKEAETQGNKCNKQATQPKIQTTC